jgi:hypothetical protein
MLALHGNGEFGERFAEYSKVMDTIFLIEIIGYKKNRYVAWVVLPLPWDRIWVLLLGIRGYPFTSWLALRLFNGDHVIL